MRHGIGWILSCLFVASAASGSAQPANRSVALGDARSLRSTILNEDRELLIALPETYGRTAITYPVLFLLDGSSHLLHGSATVRFLASARNRIPEMIVVAIPNTNRNRDMTPGPGASTFARVLAEEIIPWVEQNFRAAPERILVGHSLSASFAVHTLLNRPELFRAYVAASAPLWRYQNFDAEVRAGLPRAAKAGTAIYLAVGEHENEQLRGGMQQFAAALKAASPGNAPFWSFVEMKGEDHSSTPHRSLYNALEARYADWRVAYFEDAAGLERAGGLDGLQAHAQRVSKHFGYTAYPPEASVIQAGNIYVAAERHDEAVQLARKYTVPYPAFAERLVNQVGYDQLKRGRTDRAVQTFKQNAETFPDSPNVYDSLGDAYCRAGDAASARQSFERAARAAETRSPTHPRLASYRDKASKGCPPADQGADAKRVWSELRAALGGEEKLSAVKTVTIQGRVSRRSPNGRSMVSDVEMAFELPDKYVKVDVFANVNGRQLKRRSGFNGAEPFEEMDAPPGMMGRGGIQMVRTAQGGAKTGAQTLTTSRREFARLALGMFGSSFPPMPLEFTYAGQAESPDGKADILDVQGAEGFTAKLFVSAKSHLPLMLTWMDREPLRLTVGPGGPGGGSISGGSVQGAGVGADATRSLVEHRMVFADYTPVSGVNLPTRLQRMIGGLPIEEVVVEKIEINGKIDPARFKVTK